MKKLLTTLTLLACSTAMAQATTEVPAVTPIVSKITLSEDVTFWGKETLDTVTEVDTTVAGKAYDMLGWHITVPVYSQDVTGYGAIDIGVDYTLFNKVNFLGSVTNVAVEGGAWMPTGSAGYGTPNVNPHVGVNYDMTWGAVVYAQTFDYRFNGTTSYSPVFTNASDYLINAESFVAYKTGALSFGADLNQWYTSGSNVAFLGPKVAWNVAPNVDVNAGVGFPVWQTYVTGQENTCTVNLGVGIKF